MVDSRRGLTYLEVLLRSQDLAEKLAGLNTKGVSEHPDLLDIVGPEVGNVLLKIGGGVELEALTLEGKQLEGSHGVEY
jgi:hypothetical protein